MSTATANWLPLLDTQVRGKMFRFGASHAKSGRSLLRFIITFVSCPAVADADLPTEAKQFLRAHIQSLEQLEILAAMRSQRDREWSAQAIYETILSNEKSIDTRLRQFEGAGLIVSNGGTVPAYRYQPRDPSLETAVDATLRAYRERRVLVIETIFRPDADPAKSFADAFRFKQS